MCYRGTGRVNFHLQEGKARFAPPPPQQGTIPFATKRMRKAGHVASLSLHPHNTNRDQRTSIHTTRVDLTDSEGTSGDSAACTEFRPAEGQPSPASPWEALPKPGCIQTAPTTPTFLPSCLLQRFVCPMQPQPGLSCSDGAGAASARWDKDATAEICHSFSTLRFAQHPSVSLPACFQSH